MGFLSVCGFKTTLANIAENYTFHLFEIKKENLKQRDYLRKLKMDLKMDVKDNFLIEGVKHGNTSAVKYMIRKLKPSRPVLNQALQTAIQLRDYETMCLLLKEGADVKSLSMDTILDVVRDNMSEFVKAFLEAGVFDQATKGYAFHIAVDGGFSVIMCDLLDAGLSQDLLDHAIAIRHLAIANSGHIKNFNIRQKSSSKFSRSAWKCEIC